VVSGGGVLLLVLVFDIKRKKVMSLGFMFVRGGGVRKGLNTNSKKSKGKNSCNRKYKINFGLWNKKKRVFTAPAPILQTIGLLEPIKEELIFKLYSSPKYN